MKHPALLFELEEHDSGMLRTDADLSRSWHCLPCRGCGEHRLITAVEIMEAVMTDDLLICARCSDRIKADEGPPQ